MSSFLSFAGVVYYLQKVFLVYVVHLGVSAIFLFSASETQEPFGGPPGVVSQGAYVPNIDVV